MNDVKDAIRTFLLSGCLREESPDSLGDDTPLRTSGILDSFATMGLVSFIRQQFGIELDVYDMGIERFNDINDMAAVVVQKQTH